MVISSRMTGGRFFYFLEVAGIRGFASKVESIDPDTTSRK